MEGGKRRSHQPRHWFRVHIHAIKSSDISRLDAEFLATWVSAQKLYDVMVLLRSHQYTTCGALAWRQACAITDQHGSMAVNSWYAPRVRTFVSGAVGCCETFLIDKLLLSRRMGSGLIPQVSGPSLGLC